MVLGSNELIPSRAHGPKLALISDVPLHVILSYGRVPVVDLINPKKHFLVLTFVEDCSHCKMPTFICLVRFLLFGKFEGLSKES